MPPMLVGIEQRILTGNSNRLSYDTQGWIMSENWFFKSPMLGVFDVVLLGTVAIAIE